MQQVVSKRGLFGGIDPDVDEFREFYIMKCPYKRLIRTYPDGFEKITEVEFTECLEAMCPFWGIVEESTVLPYKIGDSCVTDYRMGCRKVELEC